MSWWNIDFYKLSAELLYPFKRKPGRIRLVFRMTAWLRKLQGDFDDLAEELDAEMKITNECAVLQSYLVDQFGEGITIEPFEVTELQYCYAPGDANTGLIAYTAGDSDANYIYAPGEDINTINAFVNVPAVLNVDMDRLVSILDNWVVLGATYKIVEA